MENYRFSFFFFFLIFTGVVMGQVGVNTTSPNSNSALHVHSAFAGGGYGGFLPPRVTLAQRNLIPVTAADDGLLVYVTLANGSRCLQLYNGATLGWEDVKCFDGPPSVTQLRILSSGLTGQTQYSFTSADIIYANATGGTFVGGNSNNICAGAVTRVQLSTMILHLTSSSTSGIVIHGMSSGGIRNLTNLETSTSLNGTYTPVVGYTTSSTIVDTTNCGTIPISTISIPATTFIRFTFSGNINLSGFDILTP